MANLTQMLDGDKLNLELIRVLLLDNDAMALEMLTNIVAGFGAQNLVRCSNAEEARDALTKKPTDLILFDAQMPGEDGYAFARWVRREAPEHINLMPMVMITSHTPQDQVLMARDHGVNFVVTKPVAPRVLLERLHWLAHENRTFVKCDTYVGPDRRFRRIGPPDGVPGRRHDDADGGELGLASAPNMSQDQIDALMKPAKVVI